MAESWRGTRRSFIRVKILLKLNIQKTKIMASGPITSWWIVVVKVETVTEFIFLGSKITVDGDCSHQIKRHLLHGRKAIINLECIEKQRHFVDRSPYSQIYGFPIVMYGYESWTIKPAQCWSIDAFLSWCCRRLLRVPWRARRSNQWNLKEINPDYSLERLMLNLQYFGHLTWRADFLEKTLTLGKIAGRSRRGWQRMRWVHGITNSMDITLSKLGI